MKFLQLKILFEKISVLVTLLWTVTISEPDIFNDRSNYALFHFGPLLTFYKNQKMVDCS